MGPFLLVCFQIPSEEEYQQSDLNISVLEKATEVCDLVVRENESVTSLL